MTEFEYELKKICIAELGFDPHLQMALRSQHKYKSAKKIVNQIKEMYLNDPYEAEDQLVKLIKETAQKPRQRQYAGFLMEIGFEQDVLSGQKYDYLRKLIGVQEYDDVTLDKVKSKWQREYANDPFSLLEGTARKPIQQESI